jgi:hypothetical protein
MYRTCTSGFLRRILKIKRSVNPAPDAQTQGLTDLQFSKNLLFDVAYCFRLMVSWVTWSKVVTLFALAW